MREIVSIQIGQCGNQIGTRFWETISDEHDIDRSGFYTGEQKQLQNYSEVYFEEVLSGRCIPRAILLDLESGTLDSIRASPLGHLFKQDNFIFGKFSASNIWAKGYHTEGAQYIDSAMDIVRKEVEICDSIQGFQISHAIGGGTGSGMGSLLMEKIRELYPDVNQHSYSIFPSIKVSDIVVEPYNAFFAINKLVEDCSSNYVIDNTALHNICTKYLDIQLPTYSDLNHLVVQVMSSTTSSFRFPGLLNSSLRKQDVCMIPYHRLHFLTTSLAPCSSKKILPYRSLSALDLVQQILSEKNTMCDVDIRKGRNLAGYAIFRGKISTSEVEEQMKKVLNKKNSNYVEWIPNNISSSICGTPLKGHITSALYIRNSTSINRVFEKLREKFTPMYRKKAYIHWYTSEGMDELEFIEVESNICDLISEFMTGFDCCYSENNYPNESDEDF